MRRLIPLFCVILALGACQNTPGGGAASEADRKDYVARVGDSYLTMDDITDEYGMLPPDVQEMFASPKGMEDLTEELIKKEVLFLEAKKMGLEKDPEVTKRLENYRKRLLVEKLLGDAIKKADPVTDQQIKDFYDNNPESFTDDKAKGGKAKKIEFERVKDVIRQFLEAENQKKAFDAYIDGLKGQYTIEFRKAKLEEAMGGAQGADENAPAMTPEAPEEAAPVEKEKK
jgi:hypothetical protein